MNVIIKIEGREAIPVRAIPYVTGWNSKRGLSPDMLATKLSTHPKDRALRSPMRNLLAYKHHQGMTLAVRRDDWQMVCVQLAGLSGELHAKFPRGEDGARDEQSRAAWQARAIELLPSGVFVWLDEFEEDFLRCFDYQSRGTAPERLDERDLNWNPTLPDKGGEIIMNGFEPQQENYQAAPAQVTATPAPVGAVESASDGPAKPKRTKGRKWFDVTETYLVDTFKAEQYPTAKDFYKILARKAGVDSPFDRGSGSNSGSLFAREVGEKVTLKMIQTAVTAIRKKL